MAPPRDELERLFAEEFGRLVRSLAVASDPETAADAVQEAFIQADRKWRKVSRLDDPVGWIRRVAVNRLANQRRNRARRRDILETVRPATSVELDEVDLDLAAAVRALPERQRLAVCLHYLAGLPVADVATVLDCAPGTVKSQLSDARRSLHATLGSTHG